MKRCFLCKLLFICYQYQCLSSGVEWGRGGSSVSHRRISLKASVSKSEENGEKEVGIALIIYKRDSYPFLLFPRNKCYQASRRNATDDIDRTRQRKTHNQKQNGRGSDPLLLGLLRLPDLLPVQRRPLRRRSHPRHQRHRGAVRSSRQPGQVFVLAAVLNWIF